MSIDFKDFLSKEDYDLLFNLYNDRDELNRPKPDFYEKQNIFNNAFANFLQALNKKQKFKSIVNLVSHAFHEVSIWNNLIKSKKLNEHEVNGLARICSILLLRSFQDLEKSKSVEGLYNDFTNLINVGNFDWFDLGKHRECSKCGIALHFQFKNWQMEVIEFNSKTHKEGKPQSCMKNEVVELDIEFKTGNLLMADWFRIEEFTKEVEYDKDYNKTSINCAKGREDSTKHAVKCGFITVHVGNSSPTIFKEKNNFIFGRVDEDKVDMSKLSYDNKNYIGTDLWNVSIIEKEQLINIVAKSLGQEKAKKKVENYLKENDCKKFKISPGNYKLRFSGNYGNFKKLENKENFPKEIEPIFTLKQA